jgi:hypothetical protein
MSDAYARDVSTRVVPFDGKSSNWRYWEMRFLAKAQMLDHDEIFTGTGVLPTEAEGRAAGETEAAHKLYTKMKKAYHQLVLSMDTKELLLCSDILCTMNFEIL